MVLNFNKQDFDLLQKKGIKLEEVLRQISLFKNGVPPIKLVEPATKPNVGIKVLRENEIMHYTRMFDNLRKNKVLYKFTPASGAASRMFKKLYQFLESEDLEPQDKEVKLFFDRIKDFAFYNDLEDVIKSRLRTTIKDLISDKKYKDIIHLLLESDGLNYGNLPKALIKFHKYQDHSRTAMEEHLVEGLAYGLGFDNYLNLHFTVSPEHKEEFQQLADQLSSVYHSEDAKINFEFSIQDPATDTIAVDMNNQPFRKEDGTLLFRPGGHGTLIYNLNNIDADFIFIKNIDNVAPDRLKPDTEKYFKALAGYLFTLKSKIDAYIEMLEIGVTEKDLEDIFKFIEQVLIIKPKVDLSTNEKKKEFAWEILNRPLRVAGMVKNIGQPGGGPFMVDYDKYISPQIVEQSQIDISNPVNQQIVNNATHFNPTFMVLSVKNYKGEKYDLLKYIDENASFITLKTYHGREIKALERPGLWNGAMAFWNTVFIEVPLTIFNPVKTVFDLLKPNHQ